MTKWLLPVELENDKYCDGCPNQWTDSNGERCQGIEEYLYENKDRNIIRPSDCPLITAEQTCATCKHLHNMSSIGLQSRCLKREGLIVPEDYCCRFHEKRESVLVKFDSPVISIKEATLEKYVKEQESEK